VTSDAIIKIILAIIGLCIAVFGPISLAMKALIGYQQSLFNAQTARIALLEKREETILTPMVDSIENMSESVKATSDFVSLLMEDMKYRNRREQESRREDGRP
jgi:hypothetical protein